jgi:hypothetical protein
MQGISRQGAMLFLALALFRDPHAPRSQTISARFADPEAWPADADAAVRSGRRARRRRALLSAREQDERTVTNGRRTFRSAPCRLRRSHSLAIDLQVAFAADHSDRRSGGD